MKSEVTRYAGVGEPCATGVFVLHKNYKRLREALRDTRDQCFALGQELNDRGQPDAAEAAYAIHDAAHRALTPSPSKESSR